jgi:hypothetical protein
VTPVVTLVATLSDPFVDSQAFVDRSEFTRSGSFSRSNDFSDSSLHISFASYQSHLHQDSELVDVSRRYAESMIAIITASWRMPPLFPASDSWLATVELERTAFIFSSELPMGSAALNDNLMFRLTIIDELNPIQRSSTISFIGRLRLFQAVRATEPDPETLNFAGSDAFDGSDIIASSEGLAPINSQNGSHGFRESGIISSKQFEWSLAFLVSEFFNVNDAESGNQARFSSGLISGVAIGCVAV